jgi:hypothetical protein
MGTAAFASFFSFFNFFSSSDLPIVPSGTCGDDMQENGQERVRIVISDERDRQRKDRERSGTGQ